MTHEMPRDTGMDNTFKILKDGYMYIMNQQERFNSDVFETRLLGQRTICLTGEEAAEIFYDENKFQREGAAPNRIKETLFGKGGVQGLDGEAHKHRKAMFMSIMSRENLQHFNQLFKQQLRLALNKWERKDEIIFYKEIREVLTRASCLWAGVLVEEDMDKLTDEVATLFESAASVGPPHWAGRMNRNKLERRIKGLVEDVRNGKIDPPEPSALYNFSWHQDLDGNYLEPEIVAVEVLNIIRPIVANAVYINFLVLALHKHPDELKKIKTADDEYTKMFIQEVRRVYPFFPFLVAVVKDDFIWRDFTFKEGTLTLLDLYGTNHHPKSWDNPDTFNPERFRDWSGSPFSFIPQGGGDHYLGHRCAGEWVTLEIMKTSLDFLVNQMDYNIPEQDLNLSMNEIPNAPEIELIQIRKK
ncbi:cytochrome P450 [Oceanobacillus alkalisoli]|uniref:cytochrome P450 n=1 Tax=Oceanobacillus alkalisoli TaxID=2925113 RepID=UPI001EF14D4B|nr:cytochrome P450 [Oceanobacillus alkalisoli]MCF3943199.1 cytochrome P450 [Oceanobacillus alkalisoli]MCG5103923.1 cytochrome P450 [Oceanobacillus alkalisoli]